MPILSRYLVGKKQRVALARAMMIDPEIIGYDEPNLCPGSRITLGSGKLDLAKIGNLA